MALEPLLDPEAYGLKDEKVELIETYISKVFLVGGFVYKVKKPVKYSYLDTMNLDVRRRLCNKEVLLNRRLCGDLYLGVVPISNLDGKKIVGVDSGDICDYAVLMRRLPQEAMMTNMLAEGKVTTTHLTEIARQLAEFHATAETGPLISISGSVEGISRVCNENYENTKKFVGNLIEDHKYAFISNQMNRFLRERKDLFDSRVKDNKIRDCHGDVQAKNIFIADRIYITDCIEFNDDFRWNDVLADVAFLAMDLEFNGHKELANHFVESYILLSREENAVDLMNYYKCHYAYVRAKVASFRSENQMPEEELKEVRREATAYYDLAYQYSKFLNPNLIMMCGPTGTGKSYLADQVAKELNAEILRSDSIRMEATKEVQVEGTYGKGVFTNESRNKVYDIMHERAKALLTQGRTVILDATFISKTNRNQMYDLGSPTVVQCTCPDDIVRKRLETRAADPTSTSRTTFEIYQKQISSFEPVTESVNLVSVDTVSAPTSELVKKVIKNI